MKTRRTAKVAEAIRQVVSSAILIELRDPRVQNVTVLRAEVAADLRTAKIYISVLGDDKTERLTLKGLNAARGWLQSKIADQLQLRLTPVLTFLVDHGVKRSIEVSEVLHELLADDDENDLSESSESVAAEFGDAPETEDNMTEKLLEELPDLPSDREQ